MGIAQALLGDPSFFIFDEPTVGLDPEERIHFRNLFSQTAQNRLVLLSTHIIEDVQSVCDQLVVIHHGRILFAGTPEELILTAQGHVVSSGSRRLLRRKGCTLPPGSTPARVSAAGPWQSPCLPTPCRKNPPGGRLPLSDFQGGGLMKSTGLFARELHRLLHSRPAWLALLLTLLSPLAGLFLYKPATADTMLSLYLANPALAGGRAGGIFFGLLAVLELDRVSRSRMDALVDAAVPPLRMALVRLTALLAVGLLATAVTMLVWLPVTWVSGGISL